MLALLRTRRWVGFTTLVIVVIVAFGLLSHWQWQRAEDKRAQRIELEATKAAPASDLASTQPTTWAPVVVTGRYQADGQVVVRRRPLNATNGFWVMAPLRLSDGRTAWVNRGWLAAEGPATSTPNIPPPPAGEVRVTGWWRDLETAEPVAGLPAGMITAPSAAELPDASVFDGYVQRSASRPQDALVVVPRETVDEGRNVSYAVQWILFAAVAIIGWAVFLWREARENEQRGSEHEQ